MRVQYVYIFEWIKSQQFHLFPLKEKNNQTDLTWSSYNYLHFVNWLLIANIYARKGSHKKDLFLVVLMAEPIKKTFFPGFPNVQYINLTCIDIKVGEFETGISDPQPMGGGALYAPPITHIENVIKQFLYIHIAYPQFFFQFWGC